MGRGRGGRKFGQLRPPSAVRTSMQELGMTATANYVGSISDVLGVSVDAARAYFPPLPEDSVATALAPTEAEISLLDRVYHLEKSLRESPARACSDRCVRSSGTGIVEQNGSNETMGLETMTMNIANYFLSNSTNNANGTENDSKKSTLQKNNIALGEWIIPEMLPAELRPAGLKVRNKPVETSAGNGKMKDTGNTNGEDTRDDGLQLLNEEAEAAPPPLYEPEDELVAFEEPEEMDDIDENADYVNASRFDDDDGYEEADSGEEGPTM